ncbi:nucleotidyltransferase family protein [Cecembia rubra]|uniref:Molybdenum cofactor cytidylyltransferase n=1 Tax=Cecembia rubra TaxID=1485585 RepID=A0A2P8EDF9_9BACT|nr:nucleotidyltransferase family protein [Cecembia rubra]PSL07529.1 molybdenum cofactor cytidylyltransferase [Cecembia rubra]
MSLDKRKNIGIVLLAAGESARLGRAKQLLAFKGKTLLEISMFHAKTSNSDHIISVLGANAGVIQKKLNLDQDSVIYNPDWKSGMSGSMKIGLSYLIEKYQIEAVIIMLSDQPFADSALINKLIDQFQLGQKGIITSSYGDTLGVPALFDQKYFPELLALDNKEGAKKIIFSNLEDVAKIDFPLGTFDIDTEEDYQKLLKIKDDQDLFLSS